VVAQNEDHLTLRFTQGREISLRYLGDSWFTAGNGTNKIGFVEGSDGVFRLHVDSGDGYTILEKAD